jgi:hypothetical protein
VALEPLGLTLDRVLPTPDRPLRQFTLVSLVSCCVANTEVSVFCSAPLHRQAIVRSANQTLRLHLLCYGDFATKSDNDKGIMKFR